MNTATAEAVTAVTDTTHHPVVAADLWVAERKALLAREKELVRLRDEIARARRALPWERVDKAYVFDAPAGRARSPTCSRAGASCWCSTSCSAPAGSTVARAARTWPTITTP